MLSFLASPLSVGGGGLVPTSLEGALVMSTMFSLVGRFEPSLAYDRLITRDTIIRNRFAHAKQGRSAVSNFQILVPPIAG